MSIRSFTVVSSLLLALMITACDNQTSTNNTSTVETVVIEHEQGVTEVPLNPQTVIVFNIATLDTMDALGIQITGVPQTSTHLPSFLSKYETDAYMNVGTLFEPNYEALSNLQPDVIIAGGRTNDAYDKLSELAPTISLSVEPKDFMNSLALRVGQLGKIFNKEEQANTILTQFKQKLATIKDKSSSQGTAIVVMINGGKMSTYGPGSRFGFIFDELGFKPAMDFPDTGRHGSVINAELLLSLNPDWLFVLDRDSAIGNQDALSAKQVLDNPLTRRTNAWNNDHIVYLDSSSMYIAGGIQTYERLLDQINDVLTTNQQ